VEFFFKFNSETSFLPFFKEFYFIKLLLNHQVKIVEKDRSFVHPIFDVLFVLSSLVLYLLTIFDEEEIFTKQAAFTRADFRLLASFLNQFLYEIVSCLAISPSESSNLEKNSYFSMFHQLLLVIYDKDCKQSDAAQMDKMWVVKEIKLKNFITDLAKSKSDLFYFFFQAFLK